MSEIKVTNIKSEETHEVLTVLPRNLTEKYFTMEEKNITT